TSSVVAKAASFGGNADGKAGSFAYVVRRSQSCQLWRQCRWQSWQLCLRSPRLNKKILHRRRESVDFRLGSLLRDRHANAIAQFGIPAPNRQTRMEARL